MIELYNLVFICWSSSDECKTFCFILRTSGKILNFYFQLTFVDEVVCTDLDLGLGVAGHAGHPPPAGSGGRQLVPGLLYIDDKGQKPAYKVNNQIGENNLTSLKLFFHGFTVTFDWLEIHLVNSVFHLS